MPPAQRVQCCAITSSGARCSRITATEETKGRCKSHYAQNVEEEPSVCALREFGFIVRDHGAGRARIVEHFTPEAIRLLERGHASMDDIDVSMKLGAGKEP